MLTAAAQVARRVATRATHRLHSLPILALSVHSSCNCRCVMCDIWKANAEKREISAADLERHMQSIRALHVERVMLTGGEPLLHRNLWALCDRLRGEGIGITLVTTGLLLERDAQQVRRTIDEVVVSVDGPREIHDAIRRVPGSFNRIAHGLRSLSVEGGTSNPPPSTIARCVIQKLNFNYIADTIQAIRAMGVHQLSFLAADVSSTAFNRPTGWPPERQADIALSADDVVAFADAIRDAEKLAADAFQSNFVNGGARALWRIHEYYNALNGWGEFPRVTCNAPWVSAVLEPGGVVRPCFFQPAYRNHEDARLVDVLNSPLAIEFHKSLDVKRNAICARCVCSLNLPVLT